VDSDTNLAFAFSKIKLALFSPKVFAIVSALLIVSNGSSLVLFSTINLKDCKFLSLTILSYSFAS